jgi:hypothetical protein
LFNLKWVAAALQLPRFNPDSALHHFSLARWHRPVRVGKALLRRQHVVLLVTASLDGNAGDVSLETMGGRLVGSVPATMPTASTVVTKPAIRASSARRCEALLWDS